MYKKQSSKKCSEDSYLWWHKQPGSTTCPKVNLSTLSPVLPVLNLVRIEFENFGPTENALNLVGFNSSFNCCLNSFTSSIFNETGKLFHNLDMYGKNEFKNLCPRFG